MNIWTRLRQKHAAQDAQRKRDWSFATDFAGEIALHNGLTAEAVETRRVARQILSHAPAE